MAVEIKGVREGSPAEKAGLCGGMMLVSLDGHEINDGLDYEFYSAPEKVTVVARQNDKEIEISVVKPEYEDLGCVFDSYLIDKHHQCKNKCVFCFIDQLPKGMRKSLYFKDDDERLSFLFGNYVTLTNLTQREIDRIIAMRISPVNISVHTANPDLRVEMMANKKAGEVLRYIPQLAEAGIALNCQLVLCPGINDGEELRRSIEWLAGFRPAMESIAAVPVGLTRHRDNLYPLQCYTPLTAGEQLDIMLEYGDRYKREGGTRLIYPSDEWFLLAGRPIPPEDFYDGYPQLQNGVGMWRNLQEEFTLALEDRLTEGYPRGCFEADVVVGTLAAPLLFALAEELRKAIPEAQMHIHVVENHFFGSGVTVSGLLTGQDIIAQLKGRLKTGRVLLPSVVLRAEGDILLDGTTPAEIEEALGAKIAVVGESGEDLLEAIFAG